MLIEFNLNSFHFTSSSSILRGVEYLVKRYSIEERDDYALLRSRYNYRKSTSSCELLQLNNRANDRNYSMAENYELTQIATMLEMCRNLVNLTP